jgi:hypothetical protein
VEAEGLVSKVNLQCSTSLLRQRIVKEHVWTRPGLHGPRSVPARPAVAMAESDHQVVNMGAGPHLATGGPEPTVGYRSKL